MLKIRLKILLVSSLLVFISACASLHHDIDASKDVGQIFTPYVIAMVGDSITYDGGDTNQYAWLHRLRERLGPNYIVHNYGVNGATALKKSNKPYWQQPEYVQALQSKPNAVFIMLGTNDSKTENWLAGNNNYQADYTALIQKFAALPSQPKVWVGKPLPAYSRSWNISGQVIEQEIHPQVSALTEDLNIQLVDLHSPFVDKQNLFSDGIHPNWDGGNILVKQVSEILKSHFESTFSKQPANNTLVTSFKDPKIAKIGRTVDTTQGVRFGYPGVSFEFNTDAQRATYTAYSEGANSRIDLYVNQQFISTTLLGKQPQEYAIFDETQQLTDIKNVRLFHRSETWQGVVNLQQLKLTNGQLLSRPELPKRKIIVVGDSVTCGAMVDRGSVCKKESKHSNAGDSYGMRLGQQLSAQTHLVCYGGRGLVRSWDNNTEQMQAPEFFQNSIAYRGENVNWEHDQYPADLILVSLGTNDFNPGIPEQENYVSTYVSFIEEILKHYPNTKVAITEGSMLENFDKALAKKQILQSYLQETKRRVNDPRLHIVASNYYPGDDCDPHPTNIQHQKMAKDLMPKIKEIMQW